jgi:hypothetical protein
MRERRDLTMVSNGNACTSSSYEPSRVLAAMRLPEDRLRGAVRLSWARRAERGREAGRRVAGLRERSRTATAARRHAQSDAAGGSALARLRPPRTRVRRTVTGTRG